MFDEQEILDYDERDDIPQTAIQASGFKYFLLKTELLRAIMDCSF
jgi:hypothetical protein